MGALSFSLSLSENCQLTTVNFIRRHNPPLGGGGESQFTVGQ
jgi:hypothetical protein